MPGVELTLALKMMADFEKANEGKRLSSENALVVIQAYVAIAQVEAIRELKHELTRVAYEIRIANEQRDMGRDTDDEAEARTDYADPLN